MICQGVEELFEFKLVGVFIVYRTRGEPSVIMKVYSTTRSTTNRKLAL